MKKIILSIITVLMIFVMMPLVKATEKPEVTDHEKVTIYIFRGEGCGHCKNAITFFANLGNEYEDYLEVKTYEVWKNSNNALLAKDVAEEIGTEFTGGVPLIVVGEKYVGGFGDGTGEELIEYALEYYQDKEYRDVVKEKLSDKEYGEDMETLKEAAASEGIAINEPAGKYDALIIIGIFVVLIGGFAALIYAGKKQ